MLSSAPTADAEALLHDTVAGRRASTTHIPNTNITKDVVAGGVVKKAKRLALLPLFAPWLLLGVLLHFRPRYATMDQTLLPWDTETYIHLQACQYACLTLITSELTLLWQDAKEAR